MKWENAKWQWYYAVGNGNGLGLPFDEDVTACLLCDIGQVPVLVSNAHFDEAEEFAWQAGLSGGRVCTWVRDHVSNKREAVTV